MNRFATALFCALLALTAVAAPPTLSDIRGSWWDEDGELMFEVTKSGADSMLQCMLQMPLAGQFSMEASGNLVFTPKGLPVRKWTASMDGEFLVLVGADGKKARYRRETREERENRCGKLFAEWAEAKRALETPNMESGEADRLWKKCDGLKLSYSTLLESLAGAKSTDKDKLLEKIAERISPAAAKAGRAAARETECANGLRQIGVYFALYESKHRAYPKDLDGIKTEDLASDPKLFRCPVTEKDDAYEYIFPVKGDVTPFDAVMAFDHDAHPDGKRCVLAFAGEVVRLDQADFDRARKDGVNAAKPRIEITSSRLVAGADGKELLVEGKVSNLRPNPQGNSVAATAWLEAYGRSKAPLEGLAVHVRGTEADQPLAFSLRLAFGTASVNEQSVWLQVRDEGRGVVFREMIQIKK